MSGRIEELSARQALGALESGPFATLLRTLGVGKEVLRAVVDAEGALPALERQVSAATERATSAESESAARCEAANAKATDAEARAKVAEDAALDRIAKAHAATAEAEERATLAEDRAQRAEAALDLVERTLADARGRR